MQGNVQEFITHSAQETQALGREVARKVLALRYPGAAVVALYGDLGGGKTTFTQGFAQGLGVEEPVRSPTFLIMKVFQLSEAGAYTKLIHIDAYRLATSEEMKHLGWDDMAESNNSIILIEWADKIADLLPENCIELRFEFIDENTRRIRIQNLESRISNLEK